jgi:hypothetical protein
MRIRRPSGPDTIDRSLTGITLAAAIAYHLASDLTGYRAFADQIRYAEEWRAELWDLAQAAVPGRWLLAHALRLVRAAWPLRAALRLPRRRSPV